MNHKFKDEIGHKYGSLTVIEMTTKRVPSNGCIVWLCKCDCGSYHLVNGNSLRFGHIRSCGCSKRRKRKV